jgi:hypothetical protein
MAGQSNKFCVFIAYLFLFDCRSSGQQEQGSIDIPFKQYDSFRGDNLNILSFHGIANLFLSIYIMFQIQLVLVS